MEKYQKKFIEKINETMKSWRDKNTVSKEELYRFLHSIKGTAATIGLEQLSHEADGKLKDISVIHHQQLEVDRVEHLLKDLLRSTIQLSTQGPSLNAVIQKEDTQREEKLILLVDDDLSTIHIIKEKLEHSGYMVLVGLTVEKALPIFYDQNPDCILINMQSKNSIDLLEVIIGNAQSRFVPVISIINGNRKDMGIQVLEEGVTDILYTPINFQELEIRVRNRIKQKELVNNAVLIDELTGAFNRRFLNLELKRYLYELKRTKQALSLAILDLDHFKKINDTYGHQVGDEILKGFAAFVMRSKRHSDYFVRYGGEEFLLILPHTKAQDALQFVNRLLKEFSSVIFQTKTSEKFSVKFSAGIAEVTNPNLDINEQIKRADIALYEAKEAGRNQVCIYGENREVSHGNKKIKIGIVDDDTIVHDILKDRLGKLSFDSYDLEIESFREGESFFSSDWHKQSGRYLIILDGMMPRMDGLEVLQKLREQYDEKKFIILMLTGRKSENDIVRALELGADDYLTKPFNFAELEARIKRLIKRMMM